MQERQAHKLLYSINVMAIVHCRVQAREVALSVAFMGNHTVICNNKSCIPQEMRSASACGSRIACQKSWAKFGFLYAEAFFHEHGQRLFTHAKRCSGFVVIASPVPSSEFILAQDSCSASLLASLCGGASDILEPSWIKHTSDLPAEMMSSLCQCSRAQLVMLVARLSLVNQA